MESKNYDMSGMRKELITRLAATLRPTSRFYSADYEAMIRAVNRKTRKELIEALQRQCAIVSVTEAEIAKHCQV